MTKGRAALPWRAVAGLQALSSRRKLFPAN
jgi:hypothetical protein